MSTQTPSCKTSKTVEVIIGQKYPAVVGLAISMVIYF